MILGIDEVGRGPWAGPLVIGAVVLGGVAIEGLTDSKKLSKKRRDMLDVEIREKAAGYGLGWVSATEIDEIGLSAALRLATIRAVEQVTASYHEIIIDGTINFLADTKKGDYVTTMKKADLLVPSVSAASIIAKVARDTYMTEQGEVYPEYLFASHVGYGTAAHRAAIDRHGVTPLHRLSFAPLKKYGKGSSGSIKDTSQDSKRPTSSKHIGDRAEDAVVARLQHDSHTILARNWRTKFCEIDIISRKAGRVYFTEVKYRKNSRYGDGLEVITVKKQAQMKFAAELYISRYNLQDDVQLAVASVAGDDFLVQDWFTINGAV